MLSPTAQPGSPYWRLTGDGSGQRKGWRGCNLQVRQTTINWTVMELNLSHEILELKKSFC